MGEMVPIEDVVDPELINTEEENVTMFDGVEVLPATGCVGYN